MIREFKHWVYNQHRKYVWLLSRTGRKPDVYRHSKGLTAYEDIYHGDCVQLIDNKWLHFINGSNCAKIPGKEKLVDKMIDNLEKLYLEIKDEVE